uniref:Uncharacterized protein n=1 Tax=Lutzomyia longipalpis TaxID=7200 RepID=A0A1B0CX75_LUTLO
MVVFIMNGPPRYGHYDIHNPDRDQGRPWQNDYSGNQGRPWDEGNRDQGEEEYYSGSRGNSNSGKNPGIEPLDPRIGTGPFINTGPREGRYVRYRGNTGAPGVAIRDDYY